MIYEIINGFIIWETVNGYKVTKRKDRTNKALFKGSLKQCKDFIIQHPYGYTTK